MGLLTEGTALSWEETKKQADHVRKHGIQQFIYQYHKCKDLEKECLYWGDEVEYMLVKLDKANKQCRLVLKAKEVLKKLQKRELECPNDHPSTWRPEYAEYMVEGTPGKPYGGLMAHFNMVEANMKLRREEIQKLLAYDEVPLSLTAFPRIGCENFTSPALKPTPEKGYSHSLFFPDGAINQGHPRFHTLTRNIRERRGKKVAINIPIYKDKNTKVPFKEDLSQYGDDGTSQSAALTDHVYLDAMGFGMGASCLQVTFQACNINEGRQLYDQLAPLCPILLALSAASPIYRGYLTDIDNRWTVIAQSVDDRTDEELGLKELKENKFRIKKSRYDSIDSYLSPQGQCYNDIDLVYDQDLYDDLRKGDVDDLLAKHMSHLFIRDPVSLFSEKINQIDEEEMDHFENIQSTNWQTMRFKPPPPNSPIGWRVEFRPMEVQLSDFENAAYVTFIVLLTRVILTYKLNLIIPISKVDENMKTAFKRDAVLNEKFYFRKDFFTESWPPSGEYCDKKKCDKIEDEYELMTVDEIFNGKGESPGLLGVIKHYITEVECDVDTQCTVLQYLKLISKRASGELQTTSKWMRNFVTSHPDYKQDSRVSESIVYDLLEKCDKISKYELEVPELLIPPKSKSAEAIPEAISAAYKLIDDKKNSIIANGH
ncbi:hypothetical protein LOTGIDRAFT_224402 [Lottia gigantea]|uniref:Glutamate--cysteine ligase n=1 Tax=Lottia gigantea TaxID=225164 RepID=V4B068_LOTGI|nr:hypothetical protein LOTGIDRAFT_224402 [Lottia gigantea]ESP03368.1 hypothetical protein LOTGIDRAFT_224402 [Lottia gigantea]